MFWESPNICDQQNVSVLDNEELDKISLEELIDRLPNLVNDYDVGNEKLIVVLKRRDILESLIKHVTETPAEHMDESVRFKYANQSCVLFSSKSNQMESELIEQPDLLDRLIDFLNTDDDLNPLMASFFSNTLFSIYSKFTKQMIDYFNGKPDFFDLLFKHIATSAIMDFLLKITTLEPITSNKELLEVYQWLSNQNLPKRSVDILRTSDDQNALENTASLLAFLIQKGRQSLISEEEERKFYRFYNEAFLAELVDICFIHKPSAIHILKILIQFIDYEYYIKIIDSIKLKFDPGYYISQQQEHCNFLRSCHDKPKACNEATNAIQTLYSIELPINSVSYEYLCSIKNLHRVIILNLEKFKQLLLESIPTYSISTTFGQVEKPLGFIRLEIIHLFYALLLANNPEMDEAFAKHSIMEHLFDLFFEYEFNTFLHNHLNNIVTTIFLNANANRIKLLTNDQEKTEFLGLLSIDYFKEKTFMQLFNLVWSDSENYQFFKRAVESAGDEQLKSPPSNRESSFLKVKIQLEYTPLVAQIFNECYLIERIMNKFKSILKDKESNPKKAVPTHKSHLIDIADIINGYFREYKESSNSLPEQLLQDNKFVELYKEWTHFSECQLTVVKKKIVEVEQNVRTQQSTENDFRSFCRFPDHLIRSVDFSSPYNVKEYEFSMQLFETQFDRAVKEKALSPDVPNISTAMDQSLDYMSKFKGEIDSFTRRFDEERSFEYEEKQKEIDSNPDLTEQYSETGEQMSNLTDRDNIFQPLASSSNISNELNIVMDDMMVDLKKESASDSFERRLATNESGDDERVNETKCELSEEVEMIIETQARVEDEDWADFEKERANK